MDSGEVIVIEDTPPSSPVKNNTRKQKPIKNMYYQPQNHEFPSAEQAMIWSRNTTNFIKESMNSVQQNNHMPLLNNNMQNVRQNNPVPFVNIPMPRPFLIRNECQFNGIRGFPRPPYTISNYNPYAYYHQPYRFEPIGNSALLNNLYNSNFWMKVKLEEVPDKGEIVSQYYIDESQTPVKMNNNQNENVMPPVPEFVDITTLANKIQNQQLMPSATRFPVHTNEHSLSLATETDDKKRNKNPVPLFLKRNRPVNNKMKLAEENHKNDNTLNNNNEDSDDIIFIGEFKHDDKLPQISEAKTTTESNAQNDSSSSDQSFKDDNKETENSTDNKYSYKCSKRKRKDRNLLPLRRNPKRQVQIEKEFLKMIDDVITESDREEKLKKNPSNKQNKPAVKTAIKQQYRRFPRVLTNSGAVYNPPSPLTNAHIRDWPTEGMHERPEFDPVTGKILPFDNLIRNISNEYNATKGPDEIPVKTIDSTSNVMENEKPFPELCHEMFHHVLAYVATVKALERDENKVNEENNEKERFLEQLDLTKINETVKDRICGILQSIVDDIVSPKYEQKPADYALIELLKNTISIYCLTNNVDQSDVAKYIASVKPADIIKLSYEQFNLNIDEN